MSVESDILALQQTWSTDASNSGTVTIDAAAISAANLTPCAGFDDLVSQYLLVSPLVVTTSSVPAPDGTTLTFQGTAPVFGASPNLTLATITVSADSSSGTTNLSIVISPAPLSAVFPAFAGDPFDVLTLTSPAVLFTTASTSTLPWNDESVTVSQGLQYQSVLNETEGPLAPIATLLGITSTSSPVLSGAIVPTPTEVGSTSIVYPVATLTASLSSEASFKFGSLVFDQAQILMQSVIDPVYGPASVLGLSVTVSVGSTSYFAINALIASNLSSICLNVVPAPGFVYSDIVALLNNNDSFTSVIPADLTKVFPTADLSLQSFGAMVGLDPLALQSLMVTIGTTQTWQAGPFSASTMGMTVCVFSPLSSSPQLTFYFQGLITAFPSILPDPFDIVVSIGSGSVIVSAAYSGTVSLGVSDIMSALSPDNSINVPTSLVPPLEFSDFRIVVEDTTSTGFIFYADVGTDDGSTPPPEQWTVLGQPIDIDVSVYIDTTQTPGLFSVTGSMTLDEQIFDLQVTFSGSDFNLSASWQAAGSSPVTLTGLAGDLGLTLPQIPAALNNGLALTGASVAYNSTGTFVLTAESQYGQAVLVAFDPQGQEQTTYAFLIQLNPISLSDLPIVGPELGAVASAGVQDIALIIAPQPITDATTISQINAAIPATYPQLPAGGVANEVTLVASMSFGGAPTPLQFALVSSGQSDVPAPAASPAPGPTWFPVQQTFGPLSIQKVGVEYDSTSSTLWFDIDASLAFGPLTLSLLGLGIGSPLATFEPSFQLQGIGVSYANPPLQIAGTLINLEPASGVAFGGDVVLSTDALTMSAVGYYGDVPGAPPSLFVFAYVAEDFGGPPAFFVTGVAAGFGFNSNVTLPALAQVSSFPFLEYLTSQPFTGSLPSPATILQSLMQPASGPVWVAPSTGVLWLAAGITFTSFQLVNSRALLIVESGSELTITLLGTSAAQYPQASTGQSPYAQLELELEASLVPSQGTFSVQGVLTPSSFLLDPKCVVTGGFAYDLWFGPSPYAGDFVLTIGGYNSAFAPPAWYPSVPPVGFQWALGSISITGNAYLALTPAVFMVGGSLDATYQSGALRAWFDVWVDVIVQWSPFYVNATLGVTIGASYTLDLLFARKTISVELGCSLEIWGPQTGGNATVHWWVFSFSFAFGANQGSASATWKDVENMLPGGSSQSGSLALQASGLLASDSNGWVVSPTTFGFTATTAIPVTTVLFNSSQVGTGDTFNIAPLGSQGVGVSSTLEVTISPSVAFTTSIIQANVPSALWGTASSSVPSGTEQLIPNQTVGLALTLAPPSPGSSVGAFPASVLGPTGTGFAPGGLPLSTSATPEGDVPTESSQTVSTIESTVGDSFPRGEIFAALQSVCPVAFDDSLDGLAEEAGCWLYAQPLLVPATTNGDAS